jgi:hypothetical protein
MTTWPGYVPHVRTRHTPAEFAQSVADGYPAVVGGECSHGELLASVSQMCLETAGGNECFNHNIGNVRGDFLGQWTSYRASEIINGKEFFLEIGPDNKFAAYPSLDAAVRRYLGLLLRKYPKALDAAKTEDYTGFVHALRLGGYFTAGEQTYQQAEARWNHQLENLPLVVAYLKPAVVAAMAQEPERLA